MPTRCTVQTLGIKEVIALLLSTSFLRTNCCPNHPASKRYRQAPVPRRRTTFLFPFLRILWNDKQCELELEVFSLSLPNNS